MPKKVSIYFLFHEKCRLLHFSKKDRCILGNFDNGIIDVEVFI